MTKFFKFLFWLLAIILVLITVIYLTAGIWLKPVVSTVVPKITKTSASLQSADISLFSGRIAFHGLKIGNPAGFVKPNAFEFGTISVRFEPKSLLTSKIIINEIKIDGTKIDAELAKSGNMNLMLLNNNVQEFAGKSDAKQPNEKPVQQQSQKASAGKNIVVKDLVISNSSLDFALLSQTMSVKLPDIHQKNIGEKKKETFGDLIGDISTMLTSSSLAEISKSGEEAVNQLFDSLAGRSKEAAGFVKELKNLF